jgi:hypothetical protein
MSLLKRSTTLIRCDICKVPFDPVFGGACKSCGRLLCALHLYGNPARRLVAYAGFSSPCVECRQKRRATEGSTR